LTLRRSVPIILTIMLLPFFSTEMTNAQPTEPNNFLTYENSTYGIKIKYPSNWEKLEDTSSYEGVNLRPIVAFFLNATEDDSNIFPYQAAISIAVANSSSNNVTSLKDYRNMVLNSLRPSLDKVIHSKPTTMIDNPAHEILYQDSSGFNNMATFTMKDNKIYLIGYVAKAEKYSSHLPEVQKMIDSFEILPSNESIRDDYNFLTYEIPYYGFRIDYPSDWKYRQHPYAVANFDSPLILFNNVMRSPDVQGNNRAY
jgi:hypothetical protein